MALVSGKGHPLEGRAQSRSGKHNCRRRVSCYEGSIGLDAQFSDFLNDRGKIWSAKSGPLCVTPDDIASSVLQLEARPIRKSMMATNCTGKGKHRYCHLQGTLSTKCNSYGSSSCRHYDNRYHECSRLEYKICISGVLLQAFVQYSIWEGCTQF